MSGKQQEGDNPRRRALARRAREQGQPASQAGVTLGAAKQPEHLVQKRRTGPVAAGTRKPTPGTATPPAPPPAGRSWPQSGPVPRDATPPPRGRIRYQSLIDTVARRTGTDFARARLAAEATVTTLVPSLPEATRRRLLAALPAALHDDHPVHPEEHPGGVAGFVGQVAHLTGLPPEQARLQAQAVLATLTEQEPQVLAAAELPDQLRELAVAPQPGGGLVGSAGATAPLTGDELHAALVRLPYWSGTPQALTRDITLPPDMLDALLDSVQSLHHDMGRVPKIARTAPDAATITVRSSQAAAATWRDVDLAHRVEQVIAQAQRVG